MNPIAIIIFCLIVLVSNICGHAAHADEHERGAGIIGTAAIWFAAIITILVAIGKIIYFYYTNAP